MGLLAWMVLVVLLSSATHLSAVDVNWLTYVVKTIRTEYKIQGQFCLAANIPLTQDKNKLNDILTRNSFQEAVSDYLSGGDVYESDDIIISEHKEGNPVHAERQVLKDLQRLKRNRQGNFLLIYSYLSPCSKCADWNNKHNILQSIYDNVEAWRDSAFVFTKVYSNMKDGSIVRRKVLEDSICDLGESMGGLSKVYRCYGPNQDLQCHSCSINGGTSQVCLDNNAGPGQGGGSTRSQCPGQGSSRKRDRSPSPYQGSSRRRDGSQSPDQGSSRRRDGSQSPDQGSSRRRDRSQSPDQGSSRRRDRSQSPYQGSSRRRDRSQSPYQGSSRKRDRSPSPDQGSSKKSRYAG